MFPTNGIGLSSSHHSPPPEFEILESRRFKSVTVSEGYPGFYEVDGDDSNDTIAISVSQQDHTFSLNGNTYTDVGYIEVHGGGGDDNISVIAVDGEGDIGAAVSGDDGNDTIALNFDGGVWGNGGNDILHLTNSFYGVADGGDGNDQIFLAGACVSADVHGGAGDDLIDGSASDCGLTIHGEDGNDTIIGSNYDDQLFGDAGTDSLVGSDGNDTLYSKDGSGDYVDGGNDSDILYANGGESSVNNVEQTFT